MGISIRDSKLALRRAVRAQLRKMSPAERETASAQARDLLQKQTVWRDAQSILFYAPMPQELDVWPLLVAALAAGKTAALPGFQAATARYTACIVKDATNDVHTGEFGIREPVARCLAQQVNKLDLVLVPGVAFDLHGRRLGRGKGFYDLLLATVRGTTIGAAFEQQVVREVPVEPHDVYLNCILTPTRWLEF
jgi:5-formyltetrahydrofolate cyclo-ligase